MSMRAHIIEITKELLVENGQFSFSEVKKVLEKEGVVFSPKSTAIRSTVYDMVKKDPRIVCAGRGVYRLASEPNSFRISAGECDEKQKTAEDPVERQSSKQVPGISGDSVMTYLDDTEKQLEFIAEEIVKMNWLQSSETQVLLAKKRWKRLNDLSKNLTTNLQGLAKGTKNSEVNHLI